MAPQVRISVIVHATEDQSRIIESLSLLGVDSDSLDITHGEGHYHNVITTITASLRGRRARRAIQMMHDALPDYDMAHIQDTLPSRTDGSALYVRLDKQEMVSGHVRLDDSGSIRIRIMIPPHDKADILRLLGLE